MEISAICLLLTKVLVLFIYYYCCLCTPYRRQIILSFRCFHTLHKFFRVGLSRHYYSVSKCLAGLVSDTKTHHCLNVSLASIRKAKTTNYIPIFWPLEYLAFSYFCFKQRLWWHLVGQTQQMQFLLIFCIRSPELLQLSTETHLTIFGSSVKRTNLTVRHDSILIKCEKPQSWDVVERRLCLLS